MTSASPPVFEKGTPSEAAIKIRNGFVVVFVVGTIAKVTKRWCVVKKGDWSFHFQDESCDEYCLAGNTPSLGSPVQVARVFPAFFAPFVCAASNWKLPAAPVASFHGRL